MYTYYVVECGDFILVEISPLKALLPLESLYVNALNKLYVEVGVFFIYRPDEGMEMQMLRIGGVVVPGSDNESITSLEYHKPNNSTIGTLHVYLKQMEYRDYTRRCLI